MKAGVPEHRAPIVIDASTTMAWMLNDERDRYALRVAKRVEESGALVPTLWRWEVQNILLVAMRRKRITEDQATQTRMLLAQLPIAIDAAERFGAELSLAREHNLSVYDAAYLELAVRKGYKLATHDAALAKSAKAYAMFFN